MTVRRPPTGGVIEAGGDGPHPAGGAAATTSAFGRALLERRPRVAAGYFSRSGAILTPDGTVMVGRGAITEVLGQLTASEQVLEIHVGRVVVNEDVALAIQYWRRRSRGHDSSTVARMVLTRSGARWEIVIANPWE
jgi:hypothetical protein